MKKSSVIQVLLLVALIGLFAACSVAGSVQEDEQQVSGQIACCDFCKECTLHTCVCEDPHLTKEIRYVPIHVCRRKCSSNILVTGQTLGPGKRLVYGNYFFEMCRSCNLVLYNKLTGEVLFSSNTTITFEPNCTLSFDKFGRLSIHSTVKGEHFTIFTIPKEMSERGDYVAVLRPGGMVGIYGPRVSSATPHVEKILNKGDDHIYESTEPSTLGNVLFSGEALENGQKLQSHNGKTKFILEKGELALIYGELVKWHSGNALCAGRNTTVARLNFHGQIFIRDSILRRICWISYPAKVTGEYVLAVQDDGRAAIYGPLFATIPDVESSFEGIRMVTTAE